MDVHLISYASNHFLGRKAAFERELAAFQKAHGIRSARVYGFDDLGDDFRKMYGSVLAQRRGGGYWLWKPYIVRDYLEQINQGDILFYADIGCRLNSNAAAQARLREYVRLTAESGILRFQLTHGEADYTNAHTLGYFAKRYGARRRELADTPQLMATFFGVRKCAEGIRFCDEWLSVLRDDPNLFTDYYNRPLPTNPVARLLYPKFYYSPLQLLDRLLMKVGKRVFNRAYEVFETHRHDQSIASLLYKVLGVGTVLPDETYGVGEDYPIEALRLRE